MTRNTAVFEGSGNVFADLGFANAEQEQLKALLTLQIYETIKIRGLTQAQAGDILGIRQPHVSSLMRARGSHFSVAKLMEFLTDLGQDLDIVVRPATKAHGKITVRLDASEEEIRP
jgi:predicted XRE-type DNA-binding protein